MFFAKMNKKVVIVLSQLLLLLTLCCGSPVKESDGVPLAKFQPSTIQMTRDASVTPSTPKEDPVQAPPSCSFKDEIINKMPPIGIERPPQTPTQCKEHDDCKSFGYYCIKHCEDHDLSCNLNGYCGLKPCTIEIFGENGEVESKSVVQFDKDGTWDCSKRFKDSRLTNIIYFIRDELGNLLEEENRDRERGLRYRKKYEYDSQGRMKSESYYNNKGKLTTYTRYKYDDNGNLVVTEIDRPPGGETEEIVTRRYDVVRGHLLEDLHEYHNKPAERWTYTYDSKGNLKKKRLESLSTNKVIEEWTYSYNEKGQLKKERHKIPGPENMGHIIYYRYNDKGNVVRIEKDGCSIEWIAPDGKVDSRTTLAYNEKGSVVRKDTDWNADGKVERRYIFKYDDNNQLLSVDLDDLADGTIFERVVYSYDCWYFLN